MLTLLISRYPSTFLVDSTTIADVENQQASHPPNTQESEKPGSCDVKSGHFSFAEVNNPPISNAQFFPETDLSQGIVGRDGLDDPANLQNFSSARQWGLLALISLIDSRISPRVEHVRSRGGLRGEDLHGNDSTLLSFSVCIFPVGYTESYTGLVLRTNHRQESRPNEPANIDILVRSSNTGSHECALWSSHRAQLRQLVLCCLAN
ncbi:uncharacterized protein ATNIH1004_010518 [Aspergillus tanneri]|uniref:Uncharacterized protein n=1 Tax=Aspergillus tanneri TaxID=1220188 RepID=A0A5M9MEM7_9EURO|nr:uncharacterized protein ATNIH1004_010518 [Aspergillus tanneri]KAA8643744.1 hypothetical protein ATNIH1004_010518 [Aspergillus tanneri]